jgi:hypothetical protein
LESVCGFSTWAPSVWVASGAALAAGMGSAFQNLVACQVVRWGRRPSHVIGEVGKIFGQAYAVWPVRGHGRTTSEVHSLQNCPPCSEPLLVAIHLTFLPLSSRNRPQRSSGPQAVFSPAFLPLPCSCVPLDKASPYSFDLLGEREGTE